MADQTEVPEQIQEEYYQTERRERTGIAWLLAFGTLIATIVVAAGIFFGGRLAYRTFVDDGDEPSTQTAENEHQPAPEESARNQEDQNKASGGAAQNQDNDGVQGSNTTPQSSTPSNSSSNNSIPNTGPSNTLAIFFGVSIFGYIIHRMYRSWYTEE